MKLHPHDALLRELLDSPRKRLKPVLEHIESCAKCKASLARLAAARRFRNPSEEGKFGAAIDRAYKAFTLRQAALEKERADAPTLLARLLELIPERQQLLLRNSSRFRTWGLLELLIQYGAEETFVDPTHAEEIFRLALNVSTHLDTGFYGRERIEDLRARAWGYIGNARRAKMDLPTAEEAFEEASQRLQKSADDILERALFFDLQSSLRRAQRRLDEAVWLSKRAVALFNRAGENHMVGKSLVKLGTIYGVKGTFQKARSVLSRSLDLIDPLREPRVAFAALHNLGNCLVDAGHFMEAQRVLTRTRPLYQLFPEPAIQNRRTWLEGKMAYGLGRHQEAKALLEQTRNGFVLVGSSFEADLVSRDMASFALQ